MTTGGGSTVVEPQAPSQDPIIEEEEERPGFSDLHMHLIAIEFHALHYTSVTSNLILEIVCRLISW